MLLEAWRQFESECESRTPEQCAAGVAAVEKRMPKRIKRKVRCLPCIWCCKLCKAQSRQHRSATWVFVHHRPSFA